MTDKIFQQYCTGSKYAGEYNIDWNGKGVYTYPDGTEYHGEFKNGHFHGEGTIITPRKFRLSGIFENGKCKEYTQLSFSCGLEYTEEDWSYCQAPDRRYQIEIERGIPPIGEGYLTKEKPAIKTPKGYFDAEEGFMNPINASLYQHKNLNEFIRTTSKEEKEWILRYCRNTENQYKFDEKILNQNTKALNNVKVSLETGQCDCCRRVRPKTRKIRSYKKRKM